MSTDKAISRRGFLRTLGGTALLIGTASYPQPARARLQLQPLNVGLISDLTGTNQQGGVFLQQGTQLAVDAVNAAGIGGQYAINLVVEDSKTSETEAVSAANRLISRDDISFVIGPLLSNHHLAVQPMFAAVEMPHIIVGSTARVISDRHSDAPLSLRYSPQDLNQMAPLAKYGVNVNGHKSFFAIAVDNAIGRGAVSAFEQMLPPLGGQLLGSEFYPFSTQDFSILIAKFAASGADALIVSDGVPAPVIALVDEYVRQGFALERLYGSIVFGGPTFFERMASQRRAEGIIFPWFYDDGTAARAFEGDAPPAEAVAMNLAFQETLQQEPGAAGFVQAWGWGAIKLIQQALERLLTAEGTGTAGLDPVRELPQAVVQNYILQGATGSETGPTYALTFGDALGFLACGQGNVQGGPATYRAGGVLLLQDRSWASDIIPGLCD